MSPRTNRKATATPPGLSPETLREFLYQMVLIRLFEDKCAEMYTKGKIRGFLHLYSGQEACAVGAINNLEDQDNIVTHYRDHGHALARGLDPRPVMAELFARVDGTNSGRGGSMHIFDTTKGFLGGYAIVAGHMPLAVGLGLGSNMLKRDAVTMCIFGDGGVAEGEFHESLNLAALWKAPVVWFCENNRYGMGVPLEASLANDVYKIAAAYQIPSVRIDGMNVLEVYEETQKAVEHCRAGKGPYFIEAMTYRYRGHSMADPELYRSREEVDKFRAQDPINRLKDYMAGEGMIDQDGFDDIYRRAEAEVGEAVQFADASPEPGLDTLFDWIYKESDDA